MNKAYGKAVTGLVAACLLGAVFPMAAESPRASARAAGVVPEEAVIQRGDAYYRLMHAFLAARRGKTSQAVQDLKEAIRLQPDSADIRADAAAMLVDLGQTAEGERRAREALEIDPENGRALRLLAALALEKARHGKPSGETMFEGITYYERVVRLPDATPEEFHDLARMKMAVGDVEGAVETIRGFLDDHPADSTGLRILVTGLVHLKRGEEAVEVLFGFLTDNPGMPTGGIELTAAVNVIENHIRDTGAWQRFAAVGPSLLAAQPDSAELHALQGESLFHLGRFEEASPAMERALELGYEQPNLRYRLASSYANQGRLSDSLELVWVLARQFPDHAGIHGLLGEVRARMGDTDGAIAALEAALEVIGTEPGDSISRDVFRRRIATLHLSRDRIDEAREYLGSLEGKDSPESLELHARTALAAGNLRRAGQMARKLKDSGQEGFAWMIEAEVLVREEKFDKARARYEEASAALGAGILARAAEVFRDSGRPAEGEEVLRGWVEREPVNPDARFSLGAYLERNRQYEAAEIELREAIRLRPDFAEALNYLGYSLADRNLMLEDALVLLERALDLDPWNGAFLDSLGWTYFRMGRFQQALEPMERAAREFPHDATVLEHLGDLYRRLGRGEDALDAYARALEGEPENPERVREKIGSLNHEAGTGETGR